jgi:hypothetical protein
MKTQNNFALGRSATKLSRPGKATEMQFNEV